MKWFEILAAGYIAGLCTAYPIAHALSRGIERLTDYLCGPPTRKGLGPPVDMSGREDEGD